MTTERWIEDELAQFRKKSLERNLRTFTPDKTGTTNLLNFSSNDYLNLTNHVIVRTKSAELLERYGSGAGASRLVNGSLPCHEELEHKLAEFKDYPSALVFGSGYLANLGVISAIVERDDHVFADKLVHASIIDAILLSHAKLHRFKHNDPEHLHTLLKKNPGNGKRLVVTESVFSMDGDLAPLPEIASVAKESGAMLMVDEAHATGVFNSGLVGQHNLESTTNISMGTLSKALAGYGGFVACSPDMRKLLINKARSFIYTTALPPSSVGAALGALNVLSAEPNLGSDLLARSARFRTLLQEAGLNTLSSVSQIIPVVVGSTEKALSLSSRLEEKGILAVPIRPPTVPQGSARLRLSVTLAHTMDDLLKSSEIIIQCAMREGVI
ncbi:MAG: 8-amino-7-oxononanoate synthase [Kiritimatiellae bacterium]|nr:8-amino-7-oxononanoate synthase [Kiritimatiellia bacterium]